MILVQRGTNEEVCEVARLANVLAKQVQYGFHVNSEYYSRPDEISPSMFNTAEKLNTLIEEVFSWEFEEDLQDAVIY